MNLLINEQANPQQIEKTISAEMEKQRLFLDKDLGKLRTGRAHPSMVEDIKVSTYGTLMPLKEIASITAPEAALIVIQPWDKTLIPDIEKAIYSSELGVNPLNDGNVIRLQIPPMNTARRQELAKTIGQKLESSKVNIRNIRKDAQNSIRDAEKSKAISQDLSKKLQDMLQKLTDKYISLCEQLSSKKEEEIKG